MIHIVKQLLQDVEIHLASSSPRRKNILEHVGLKFQVTPSTFEENLDKSLFTHPKDYVIETSKHKAVEVMESLISKDNTSPKFVIGTDTVVVIDGKILEKPADHDAAYQMLKSLNKSHHQVYSGVTLLKYDCEKDVRMRQFYECTDVMLGDIPDNVIRVYANSIEPLDKAGGYLFAFAIHLSS